MRTVATRCRLLCASLGLVLGPAAIAGQSAADLPVGLFDRMSYRHIGPVGNRVSAVAGVPGAPNTYYFGAASGGVWKTTDGGVHWDPIFDDQRAQSVGAIAVAASNPDVIWVGTGEAHIRSNVSIGDGVYRSIDGGESWEHRGLEETGRVGRILIHPGDPDRVYVAALGHLYGPQQERGVFRTTDGGRSWERVLFADEDTGAYDLIMDPNNPDVVFATTWTMLIRTWGRWSGGPGSGIYRTGDGGDTWTRLEGNGLPEGTVGKIGLAMSASSSEVVYALIETNANREVGEVDPDHGVLWRSEDGGSTWSIVSSDHALNQRPLYYTRIVAAPDDPDEVHTMATRFMTSTDGGRSFQRGNPGGDHHDMWIDPLMPNRMIVGHDQGVSISVNRGGTWMRPRLPIAQMYHVYTDNQIPYRVYGNRQDGASWSGPSNHLRGASIPIGAWHSVGGCESGFAVPDPEDPNVVWSGCYEGILARYDHRSGHARTVSVWPDNPEAWPGADLRYRFQWTFPITISPHDHERVYVGSQYVHVTTNEGQSWQVISPDLTTNDKTKQQKTGGLTPDDAGPTIAAVLFAIAESPIEAGVIWAGSNDGLLHVTRDGGATWTNVTGAMAGLPPWGTVSNIEPSRHAAGTAYVSVDFHQVGDTNPYIYKTTDYGASWTSLSGGIPRSTFSYVHVVREHPARAGLLFAGTENGLYVSFDDGSSWSPLQANLPHAPVHWLEIQPHFNDLVVATYGRGFWIMDDLTAVRDLDPGVLVSNLHLFDPRPAYRFRNKTGTQSQPEDPGAGDNPEYGASIDFYLADEPPDGEHSLEIHDAKGAVVRTLTSLESMGPGINRVYWNLREESSRTPKLRTLPLEHEHVEFNAGGWRPAPEGGRVSPLAAPGRYTARLTIGDEVREAAFEVLKDPSSDGTQGDIEAQLAMVRGIRGALDQVVDLIDEIEIVREGIEDLPRRLEDVDPGARTAALIEAGETLERQLIDLEMLLFDLRLTGGNAGQDSLRWGRRLYAKLASLAGYVSGTDHRPTDQSEEVFQLYLDQLAEYQARMEVIRNEAMAEYNRLLVAAGLGPVGE